MRNCIKKMMIFMVFIVGVIVICKCARAENSNLVSLLSSSNTYNYDFNHQLNQTHYDMNYRNDNVVDDDVLLTILTPGLGGSAEHWSSIKDENGDYVLGNDRNNLISALCLFMDNKVNIKRIVMKGSYYI